MGSVKHTFPFPIDRVYAALTDEDHMTKRAANAGDRNIACTIREEGDTLVLVLARDIESDIPSFAKKVVDPVNRVSVTFRWKDDGAGKRATYEVDVNPRIHISGVLTLRSDGDRTVFEDKFDAKVSIPLIGGKIGKLVEEKTADGVRGDCRFTESYLRG